MSWVVGLSNNSCKHITNTAWVRARLCILQIRVHSLGMESALHLSMPSDCTTSNVVSSIPAQGEV
jgi:hypothetical protein